MIKTHKRFPFHKVEIWTNDCFVPSSLINLGYTLHLGHNGDPCPVASHFSIADRLLWIVDSSGVYQHKARQCLCVNSPEFHIQLLMLRLYPSTIQNPETAFTFSVLENFHIDTVECKTSANNFFNKLKRLTNNAFPHTVPVWCVTYSGEFIILT